jgi:translin
MINFTKLQNELKEYDEQRELLIKKSRDVLKLSKLIIYAVHRDEMEQAVKLIKEIEQERKELEKIALHDAKMAYEGSYKIAIQEYVEAILYYEFVKSGKLPDLKVLAEHFILGLSDLPGELVRRAVYLAGKGEVEKVKKIRDEVDAIYGEMLKFDFRDNEIRRKVDSIKYELRKLEDLVLDLKLKGRYSKPTK